MVEILMQVKELMKLTKIASPIKLGIQADVLSFLRSMLDLHTVRKALVTHISAARDVASA